MLTHTKAFSLTMAALLVLALVPGAPIGHAASETFDWLTATSPAMSTRGGTRGGRAGSFGRLLRFPPLPSGQAAQGDRVGVLRG